MVTKTKEAAMLKSSGEGGMERIFMNMIIMTHVHQIFLFTRTRPSKICMKIHHMTPSTRLLMANLELEVLLFT